jgi:TolA-binding protein
MIALTTIAGFLGRLPRTVWIGLLALAAVLAVSRWHQHKVNAAFVAGGIAQASIDRSAIAVARATAERAQQQLRQRLAAKQGRISTGVDDGLLSQNVDLVRRYDDLRMRWAAYRADQGGAGGDRATAVSRPAAILDAAACSAAGWVSFDTAATAAQAADTAIARDDAWRTWVTAQAAAWPKPDAEPIDGPM